jgi:hypothetical protein
MTLYIPNFNYVEEHFAISPFLLSEQLEIAFRVVPGLMVDEVSTGENVACRKGFQGLCIQPYIKVLLYFFFFFYNESV